MALIIPEAQTPFSLVEQPRANPNMATGAEGLGALADVGVEVRARKVKAEQDRTLRTARLTAMENLDTLRFQYENDTNLDGMTDRWDADATALTKSVADQLPAHLREDFQLSMREMVAPQTSQIRRREYALFQDREMATLNGDLRRYETSASKAPDEKSRNAILTEAAADIGRAVDAGLMSAVEGERMMADLPANVAKATAIGTLEEDPEGYLQRAEAGEFDALDPVEQERNRVTAKGLVAAEETRRARENDLVAKAVDKEMADKTDAAIKVIEGGLPYAGLPSLLEEVKGTPYYDQLQSAVDAGNTAGNFALLTPAEQKAEMAAIKARDTKNPADVGRVNRLATIAENTQKSLDADPLAHVRDRRIMPVAPVDISNPASVASRIAEAETIYREYTPGASSIRYFDATEASRLAAILAGPDTDQALGVVSSIANTFGDRAPAALAQLGEKDSVPQLAGALLLQTGDPAAARAILRGRSLKAEGKGAEVSSEVRRAAAAELAPAFPTAGDPRLSILLDAADAHYAASGISVADPKSPEAKAAYKASLQAASAGTTRNGVTYGGVQPVNGKDALLPADLTAAAVEQAVVNFGPNLWQHASATGSLPKGFENFKARDRENWTVLSLKDGTYAVGYRTANGAISYLTDDGQKDGVFRFDLHALVTGRHGE